MNHIRIWLYLASGFDIVHFLSSFDISNASPSQIYSERWLAVVVGSGKCRSQRVAAKSIGIRGNFCRLISVSWTPAGHLQVVINDR